MRAGSSWSHVNTEVMDHYNLRALHNFLGCGTYGESKVLQAVASQTIVDILKQKHDAEWRQEWMGEEVQRYVSDILYALDSRPTGS